MSSQRTLTSLLRVTFLLSTPPFMTRNTGRSLETPPNVPSMSLSISPASDEACLNKTEGWNEEALRQFNQINLTALIKIASRLSGKTCIPLIQNTRFDRFNIIVVLLFEDNSAKWVAKFPLIGGKGLTANDDLLEEHIDSMVATMKYVSEKTSIPVPRVHHWESNSSNDLGRPYIIMDSLPGSTLYDLERSGIDMDTMIGGLSSFVNQWAQYYAELTSLHFNQIGNLTPDDTIGKLCAPAHLHFSALLNGDNFRGPFSSTLEYLFTTSEYKCRSLATCAVGHSYQVFLQNKLLESMMPFFVGLDYANGPFVLRHMNFDLGNIMVELDRKKGVRITGVAGWEFACVGPLQSQICLPQSLTADEGLAGKKGKTVQSTWRAEFAKRYRNEYKECYLKHLRKLKLDYPAHLLDHGHWFTKYEKAMSIGSDEESFDKLWTYIYGKRISWQNVIENIESSDWGLAMAERFASDEAECDDDGKSTIIVSHSRPQTRASFQPSWKPTVNWRMRVVNHMRWGLWRVEQCLLCQCGEKRVAVLMRSKRRTTVSEITEIGNSIKSKDQ